jgi:uncharacterized membrane-anchored protein YitT (DUF2179 family)
LYFKDIIFSDSYLLNYEFEIILINTTEEAFMKKFKQYLLLNIGLLMVAGGIYYFLVPNDLAAGGVSGLAMVINHYFSTIPIGALMLAMNFILFITAFFVIGHQFAIKTVNSSFMLSGMIWALQKFFPIAKPITDDLLIQLIFGILFSGIGMAIVFNTNSSTGGTDIIAKIINKFFHVPIGKSILMTDFVVTLFAAITFGPRIGMYSLLGVIINGLVIDNVIEGLNISKQVVIITSQVEPIQDYIINVLERGATIYLAKGAYTNEAREVITVILNQKEFIKLRNFIKEIDKRAFITVSNVHEALGEGFTENE